MTNFSLFSQTRPQMMVPTSLARVHKAPRNKWGVKRGNATTATGNRTSGVQHDTRSSEQSDEASQSTGIKNNADFRNIFLQKKK